MAHFRGVISGGRGEASRLGSRKSGMRVEAQSWQGKVVVYLDHRNGVDWAEVSLARHNNAGDIRPLWEGPVSGAKHSTKGATCWM